MDRHLPGPVVREISDFVEGAESLQLSITQLFDAKHQRVLVKEWCRLLPSLGSVRELEFLSRVNQAMFEAACEMPQLTSLRIKWSGIRDLSPIINLKNLRELRIGTSGGIQSIEPIGDLENLRDLELEDLARITDFSVVARLHQLERLRLDGGFNKPQIIDSLAPMSGLTNLQYLSIRNARLTKDGFDPILRHTTLTAFHSASGYFPPSEFEKLKSVPNLVFGNVAELEWGREFMKRA